MKLEARVVFVCLVISAAASVAVEPVVIKATVSEPAGIARMVQWATGGIPFKPGQVKSLDELTLVRADGQQVPAQFSKLAPYEDGSIQWVLLDFWADVPAGGKSEYTVRTGKPLTPPVAVKVEENEERVTVTTGPAEFVVNKRQFSLLESVKLGPTRVAGPGEVTLINSEGQKFQAGPPARVLWEYRGPLRATLRVEGPYTGAGGEYTAYTTRLTFIAGSSAVKISHSIRNSHPTNGFDALIKQATLGLALHSFGTDQGRGKDWVACGDGKIGVLMVERHTAGCFPAGLHQFTLGADRLEVWVVPEAPRERKKSVGYGEGFFALADLAHKDSEIWLDFYTGSRDTPANEEQAKRLRSKLIALADGAWISETATLTCGKFGTLEDEIATYQRWGWKGWDDEKKRAPARKPHIPDAHVEKVDIHDESESDSVELFMLMFVRTGERGFFDLGEAYAGYYKGHAVWRTDGFEYDGFRHERAGVVAKSKRKSTALGHGWYSPKEYGWSDSRFHMCHQWATGLIDYYCLTGDTDALEAGLDWAEYAAATYPEQKPGQRHGWGRAWGRSFGIIVRAYQVTRDPKWKAMADVFAGVATRAPNRRPDGLYENDAGSMTPYFVRDNLEPRPGREPPIPPRLKQYMEEKGLTWKTERGVLYFSDKEGKRWMLQSTAQSFEYAACAEALARYAEVMNDAEAKKLVVDMAKCARDYYWSRKCEHAIPKPYIGFPDQGKVYDRAEWDDSHANCPNDPGGRIPGITLDS